MLTQLLNDLLIRLLNFLRLRLFVYSQNSLFRPLRRLYYEHIKIYLLRFVPFPFLDGGVMVSLTYECQCRCSHCCGALYRQAQKRLLNSQEVMKLIDESKRLGVSQIYFVGGEPLLVSNLPEYIRYAKKKGLMTRLDTNGFLLNGKKVKELKEAGLDMIGVSIDSPFETIHDVLRGVNGIFKRAVEGVKYCKKYNIACYISTYATKENLKNGELKMTINLAKSMGVKVRIMSPIAGGRWLNREDIVLSLEEIALLRNYLERGEVFWGGAYLDNKEIPYLCYALRKEFFYISAYGDVQACPFIPISFGNIREEPLKNILKRMWSVDLFTTYKGSYDCPVNVKNFIQGQILKQIKVCFLPHSHLPIILCGKHE